METEDKNRSKTGAGITKRGTLNYIDPTRIVRRKDWNPRTDFGDLQGLAASIEVQGLLMPLHVKRLSPSTADADFELIDGDRRLTAVELLIKKHKGLPVSIVDGVQAIFVDRNETDAQSRIKMFLANTGKPFEKLEEANAYKLLQDDGMKVADISKSLGRSAVHIYAMLDLLNADDSVKEALDKGEINKSQAKKIAHHAKGDKVKQAEIVAEVKSAGKTKGAKSRAVDKAVTTQRKAKAAKKGKTIKMRALSDAELSELGVKVAGFLTKRMEDAGKAPDFNIRDWAAKDDNYALAYTFGALEALKAAAGQPVELSI